MVFSSLRKGEKELSLYTFPLYIFFSILLGGIFGTLLDKMIVALQDGYTTKSAALLYLFFQLIIMSFLIYVFVFGYFSYIIPVENFATGTFFFNLAFFTLQPSIASNLKIILNAKTST